MPRDVFAPMVQSSKVIKNIGCKIKILQRDDEAVAVISGHPSEGFVYS